MPQRSTTDNPISMAHLEFLSIHGACLEARQWARDNNTTSLFDAVQRCKRADWVLWLLSRIGDPISDNDLRKYACWAVRNTPMADGRKTWDLLTDERSRTAVEVAERFADGNATAEELYAAGAVAWAAAGDAAAAGAVAWAAQHAELMRRHGAAIQAACEALRHAA